MLERQIMVYYDIFYWGFWPSRFSKGFIRIRPSSGSTPRLVPRTICWCKEVERNVYHRWCIFRAFICRAGRYHGGLEELVGQPNPNLMEQMAWEHIHSQYAKFPFEVDACASALGPGKTFAAHEYEYVVDFPGAKPISIIWVVRKVRFGYPKNQLAEVIALRLYAGPLYVCYNSVKLCTRFICCTSTVGPSICLQMERTRMG